jgi:hypothetical protein
MMKLFEKKGRSDEELKERIRNIDDSLILLNSEKNCYKSLLKNKPKKKALLFL